MSNDNNTKIDANDNISEQSQDTAVAILDELKAIRSVLNENKKPFEQAELNSKLHDAKQVEYYASCVDSWFSTTMEMDKSLLTLSAGGIGILVTFLSSNLQTIEGLILYILALCSFIGCLAIVLCIFKQNAKHLERLNNNEPTEGGLLKTLDVLAMILFLFAVAFTSIIGISAAVRSQANEAEMVDKKQPLTESVKDIKKMQPHKELQNGFGSVKKMQPSDKPSTDESKSK